VTAQISDCYPPSTYTRTFDDRIETTVCTDDCRRLDAIAHPLSDITSDVGDDTEGIDPVKSAAYRQAWLLSTAAHKECVTTVEYREQAS
jgi:hypothetical protein